MQSKVYTSNLTQSEYETIKQFLPEQKTNKLTHKWIDILNGIFYVEKNGCVWRDIPADLPPWEICYYHFKKFRNTNFWEKTKLEMNKKVRSLLEERKQLPSCILIDSQSVKNTDTGCESGIDGNKKVKGIKRHILCDTLGLNWDRAVTPANIGDREGALVLAKNSKEKGILDNCITAKVDQGYTGENFAIQFYQITENQVVIEVVEKLPDQQGFQVLPMRWVIERSNAWMDKCRRMWKNCERLVESAEAMIDICFLRIVLRRLGKSRMEC
jgi:putative transposase